MFLQFKIVEVCFEAHPRYEERLREMGSVVLIVISGRSRQLSLKITSGCKFR